ncbi:MAG: hypothetical protein IT428_13875 [Planctomycetaceae bacterium]|nr:hypothetical protein [Planctomycetaceae bacterium]
MALSVHEGDMRVTGTLSASNLMINENSVTKEKIPESAGIEATKLVHQHAVTVELFGPSTTVAALSKVIHIARSAGQVVAMEAIVQTKATGADRTIAVDLKKGNSASAYATVLSATANFTNGSTNRAPVSGTISDDDYVDGDSFQLDVAVAGAAGNQAIGLTVTVWLRENPD